MILKVLGGLDDTRVVEAGTALPARKATVAHRVLVVEDSAVIQRLIGVCLRPAGVEVETRDDGPSGLEAALSNPPDLLILDVGLPRMDGWEVLERIRNDVRTRDLKVLVLTAHAQEETRERADRGGETGLFSG